MPRHFQWLAPARKRVSRNAVYQAERSEKEGAVSLKQMELLAKTIGSRSVQAIIPDGWIIDIKYCLAIENYCYANPITQTRQQTRPKIRLKIKRPSYYTTCPYLLGYRTIH